MMATRKRKEYVEPTASDRERWRRLPRTSTVALRSGVRWYFTDRACAGGHMAPRYATSGACVVCHREVVRVARAVARMVPGPSDER